MSKAKVQTINTDKGFGFLRPSDGGPDVFFHCSVFRGNFNTLAPGLSVTYEVDEAADRPKAKSVSVSGGVRHSGPPREGNDRRSPKSRGVDRTYRKKGTEHGHSDQAAMKRPHRREPPRRVVYPRGFITKMHHDGTHGHISADAGGTEIVFQPNVVKGKTPFPALHVGDYVEFEVISETMGTKHPEASYVRVIERTVRTPYVKLPRHPRARGKKPSWR